METLIEKRKSIVDGITIEIIEDFVEDFIRQVFKTTKAKEK